MSYITVGTENSVDVELHYTDQGPSTGTPVVLIHGYPLNGESWARQQYPLLDAGYRVIAYDRRGFGASTKTASGADYDTYAADLHALMEELDLRDAALLGFSMGTGEIARYLGRYGADRVAKAGLLSGILPYLLATDDNPDGAGPQGFFDDLCAQVRDDRFAFVRGFFEGFYNLEENLDRRISQDAVDANVQVAAHAGNVAIADATLTWPTDFRADIAEMAASGIPCLIMHGTADNVVPIDASARRLRDLLPEATYVELEGAPHGLLWTHADQVNEALSAFLSV